VHLKQEFYVAEMSPDQRQEFLAPTRIAVLGTINADGTPALNPVWYAFEDGVFRVVLPTSSYYAKNVLRDPRISICVQHEQPPYKGVVAHGKAVVEGEGAEAVGAFLRRLAIRYFGEHEGNKYADGNSGSGDILVSLRPERVGSWDYGT
jgi:PPOX class probable F420-dependent enzyme